MTWPALFFLVFRVFLIVLLLDRRSSALTSSQQEPVAFQYPAQSYSRLPPGTLRLSIGIVVAAGSYAAMAFLVAAKGLIRSEDLRDRDFAEYFLIGSLASVLVALCAGLLRTYACTDVARLE